MTNLESVLKSRHITLPIKVHKFIALVFPLGIRMWELDLKTSKCQRTDAFKLWCWRRLLRVHGTARRSNQSILKEINPEFSLEGLMLKLQYSGQLRQRVNSLEKSWMLWKIKDSRRGWDGWMALLIQRRWVWANSGRQSWTGKSGMLQSMESQPNTTKQLNNNKHYRKSKKEILKNH